MHPVVCPAHEAVEPGIIDPSETGWRRAKATAQINLRPCSPIPEALIHPVVCPTHEAVEPGVIDPSETGVIWRSFLIRRNWKIS